MNEFDFLDNPSKMISQKVSKLNGFEGNYITLSKLSDSISIGYPKLSRNSNSAKNFNDWTSMEFSSRLPFVNYNFSIFDGIILGY